jgi:hypothetical protein
VTAVDGTPGDAGGARTRVSGSFQVTLTPQPADAGVGDPSIARMALHKVFEGALAGEARGQMLATRTATPGSAGYVALDRFEGALDGRSGGFSLQHSGTMDRGTASLSITVVPDSGTGELAGLQGTLAIRIEDGGHFYDFDYRIVAAAPAA